MIQLNELITYTNELLNIDNYQDYCPNGLQVVGRTEINKIVTGVSANQELLDKAVANNADAILVHHGYFWKGENPCIVGIKKHRLQTLLKNNISLIAYHLPLDYHDLYGNNVQLAKVLDIKIDVLTMLYAYGEIAKPMSGEGFAAHIKQCLNHEPLYIPGKAKQVKSIAWCVGGAENYLEQVAEAGFDAYLTGEISERTVDIAKETGIHLFVAGHEITERYGIKALGEHLSEKFNLQHINYVIPEKAGTQN
jgi:dinuclear metal center YbgI/SA1388 family protein